MNLNLNKKTSLLIFSIFLFVILVVGCSPSGSGPTNQTPIITSTPITTATVGATYAYNVTATDSDGNTLTFSLTISPTGMTINSSTGLISWTPTAAGDYDVMVEVSDNGSPVKSITQSFTIHVEEQPGPTNQPPTITSTAITTATVNQAYSYNVDATDPDGDTLTYFLVGPAGMTINFLTGLIAWTPTTSGDYNVTIEVSDGDLSDTQSFIITITETLNQSPTASFTADPTSGVVPLEVSFNGSNSSDSDGSITSYAWDFKDGETGNGETISHTFSSIGSCNVELTVTDNEGATDSTTKTITVTETPNQSSDCYESMIVSPVPFMGNNGEIFKLIDGSLWEVKYEYEYLYEYYPSVVICPSQGKLIIGGKSLNVELVASGEAVIESTIISDFNGLEYGNIYELANGQIWQQTEYYIWYWYWFYPGVLIWNDGGIYRMKVEGIDHPVMVKRIN